MKRRNQEDHIIARNNKPEVTISVYDNGRKRSKWIGGISVTAYGDSVSYDGFRTRALQNQTFEATFDRLTAIVLSNATAKDAAKPKEQGSVFDRFTSALSEFSKIGGLDAKSVKREPDTHPESVEAARTGDSAIKETNSARFGVGVTLPGQHIDEPHTVPVVHEQPCDTDVKDAVKSYLRTYVRIGGKRLDLKNGLADAERCLNNISAANLRALWPTMESDAREIAALRDFVKDDIAEGEHPVAAAIRCMKSLTESNRRPVQWVRSADGLPTDCPIGFAPDGDWQLASNDSGVVTWRRPMRAEKVHHKTIVVLRSPKNMYAGRRGKACFVGDRLIAMWLDVGNGAERVQSDGIEWGDA